MEGGGGIKGWMKRMNGGREEGRKRRLCRWWYEKDKLMERRIYRGIKKIILNSIGILFAEHIEFEFIFRH